MSFTPRGRSLAIQYILGIPDRRASALRLSHLEDPISLLQSQYQRLIKILASIYKVFLRSPDLTFEGISLPRDIMDDFRIDYKIGGSRIGPPKDNQFSRLQINSDSSSKSDLVSIKSTVPERQSGHYIFISNINSAAEIAKEATEQIASLRQEQVALADEAQNTVQGTRLNDLNTRSQELQTEITRIANNATFNGSNVLSGATYTITVDALELHTAITFPNASSIAADPGITYSTQSGAATAYDSFQIVTDKAYQIRDSLNSVSQKAEDLLEKTSAYRAADLTTVKDEASAKDLANDIANKIGSPFSAEFSFRDLIEATIGDLDQESSKELLSDE